MITYYVETTPVTFYIDERWQLTIMLDDPEFDGINDQVTGMRLEQTWQEHGRNVAKSW
jgi:hypothetical protein